MLFSRFHFRATIQNDDKISLYYGKIKASQISSSKTAL